MVDFHIHIGQFNEIYYDAIKIFEIIESLTENTGIHEIHYSSTSTCRDDVELKGIEEEIEYAQNFHSSLLKTKPYLWYIPKYADQNISVESASQSFDYCGIKLHPLAQEWNLLDQRYRKSMEEIFRWADDNRKDVLIHCGPKDCDLPTRFEPFIREYKNARVILAHSNPVNETALMVNRYANAFCDIACTDDKEILKLKNLVSDKSKILFGSDFPVSHYWNTHLFEKKHGLKEEYAQNCKKMKLIF